MTLARQWAVVARGIGRADYSAGIESAVEPTIRSYQNVYSHYEAVTFVAGEDTEVDISITSGYVVLLYDFYAAVPASNLFNLIVKAISDSTEAYVVNKSAYGTVSDHVPKGFPFFKTIRFIVHNYGDEDIDGAISCTGIEIDEQHYYLTVT